MGLCGWVGLGKHAIRTKWVYRNKKGKRGIVVRNKARLVTQGYTQEEGIDYDKVFAPVARIEAIMLFLACASFIGFIVYQMDVKSAFLYGTIEEEVYVCQPPGFEDPYFHNKVYKVEKALYGLHQDPRAWINAQEVLDEFYGELTFFLGLQVMLKDDGIFISQGKYVADILKKFDFSSVKTSSTLIETNKALHKDEEAEDVNVYLYRSMIRSLMYLTASRPDRMFAVCACARFQVTLKISHLHAVKRIFRYLKGQPKLGLWYLRDSPFDLEAFSDSDYAGASLDRKSTTGGYQFLRKRLISWQCKKQTVVADSTTKTEYVAGANYCGQVLRIQNQMLDYGFNFMNTKIYIDNESTICIVKNIVYHSKPKHIEIRHHFIKDSYEKRLIQFWQTATTRTLDNGEIEITAIIDGKVKIVTETSVRRHLKLKDSDGISILPTAEIFEQLALIGPKKTSWEQFSSNIATTLICFATNRTFNFCKLIFDGMVKSLDIFQGEGSTVPVESHHTPTSAPSTSPPHFSSPPKSSIRQETKVPRSSSPTHTHVANEAASIGVDIRLGGAATTITSLDAGHDSGIIDKTPSMSHDSPLPRVNPLGSDEGSMALQELTVLCTILSQKVESLEADLKQTKKVYGAAYTKLIIKVKKLEKTIKTSKARRKAKIIVSDEELDWEDPSKQGRISTAGMVDKGKGIVEESKSDVTKTKRQQEQERLSLETTVRLQEKFDEEERKRIARVHEAAKTFTKEEWENIKARVEADEELTQRLQAEERNKYSEVDQAKILLKKLSFDEIKEIFEVTIRSIHDFVPMESEDDKAVPKLAEARSSKRDTKEELDQGRSKKQKIGKSSEPRDKDVDELSQEEL
nr:hypothetical protein [Tanacetum cinerariifolium]